MAKAEKKKLRVGFAGSGAIAITHAEYLKKSPEVELVCASDVSEASLKKFGEKTGVTRTLAAFRDCAASLNGAVIAIGYAPTALLEVTRLIEEDGVRPALVIGVPVGFVQAEESKNALWDVVKQPSITVLGRKGGSSVAVAIVHALLELAKA